MAKHYDGIGNQIKEGNGLHFEEVPFFAPAKVCDVPGCENAAHEFGVLEWGGPIGAVCDAHRHDQDAIDDLITAKFERH